MAKVSRALLPRARTTCSAGRRQLTIHGAPESILYDAKPHVGTDYLRRVLTSLRQELVELGCEIRFGHRPHPVRSGSCHW